MVEQENKYPELEQHPVETANYDQGLEWAANDIMDIVGKKERVLVTISGKTGAGKTEFANRLKKIFLARDIVTVIISMDKYILKKKEITETTQHDVSKIFLDLETALNTPASHRVVIVEGLEAHKPAVVAPVPDYKILIEGSFAQRIARRLVRDEQSGFRSLKLSMNIIIKVAVKNPLAILTFEHIPKIENLNLAVHNTYLPEGESRLFIKDNCLLFGDNKQIRETVVLDSGGVEKDALLKLGIREEFGSNNIAQ